MPYHSFIVPWSSGSMRNNHSPHRLAVLVRQDGTFFSAAQEVDVASAPTTAPAEPVRNFLREDIGGLSIAFPPCS